MIPRDENPFVKTAQELISDTVPKIFLSEDQINTFPPHVTVTSDIETDKVLRGKSPQEWLDGLALPEFKKEHDEVVLELDTIEAEEPVFRKLNLACKENANLRKLAAACRQSAVVLDGSSGDDEGGKAQAWAQNEYRPHFSLLYADIPTQEVQNKVPLIEMKIGFALGDLFACCGGALCLGGWLVLVDTTRPIREWKDAVVARRETPWAIWRASRNLI